MTWPAVKGPSLPVRFIFPFVSHMRPPLPPATSSHLRRSTSPAAPGRLALGPLFSSGRPPSLPQSSPTVSLLSARRLPVRRRWWRSGDAGGTETGPSGRDEREGGAGVEVVGTDLAAAGGGGDRDRVEAEAVRRGSRSESPGERGAVGKRRRGRADSSRGSWS